jgi:hypothetical protein
MAPMLPEKLRTVAPSSVEGLLAADAHIRVVHEAQVPEQSRAHDLAAQVHVLHRVEVGGQGQVLVHGLDPVAPRRERAVDGHRLAVDQDLARSRRLGPGQDP